MSKNQGTRDAGSFTQRIFERLFFCPRGKHSRSFAEVRPEGDRYVSKCRGCGIKMVRLSKRNWVVDPRG